MSLATAVGLEADIRNPTLWIEDGELLAEDPRTIPTFFDRYLGDPATSLDQPWRTGDRVTEDDDGYLWLEGRTDDLKRTLQEHVKAKTAPYKYPRQVEFIRELPKTPSGKVKRAELRTGY